MSVNHNGPRNVGRCIRHTVHAVVQPNVTVHNACICLQTPPSDAAPRALAEGHSDAVKTRPLNASRPHVCDHRRQPL